MAIIVTVGLSVLAAAGPAASATRNNRDHGRNPNNDKSTHRNPDADQSSRRQYGDPSGDTGFPAEFVAELNGRIVVVAAATGRIQRRLTPEAPGGGASGPAVGPDGRTVWFSRGDGSCAAHIAFVPAAGGPERSLPGSGEDGPESTPLPRPGHDQLAYSRHDCHAPTTDTLVVGDLRGLRAHGQSGLVPMAWTRDGGHLLARASDHDELHLLDIADSGAITDDEVLAVADRAPDCRLQVVGFSPDENSGYVATRHCGPSSGEARRSLVLLGRDGRIGNTVLRLPRGQDFVGSPTFDRGGHSLLYATAPVEATATGKASDDDVSLWLWRDGNLSRLARPSRYGNPAWLP